MGKGVGKGKMMMGGAGVAEGVGQIAYCLCCLIILGPILIIIGIVLIGAAIKDNRLTIIKEYDASVQAWNALPPATFQGMDIGVSLSSKTGLQARNSTLLLGQIAPEDVGDQSLRKEEHFSTIVDPWYYNSGTDNQINNIYMPFSEAIAVTTGSNSTSFSSTSPSPSVQQEVRAVQISLTFTGSSINLSPTTLFYPIVEYDTPYRWHCNAQRRRTRSSRRRSKNNNQNSCLNTCNNPSEPTNRQNPDHMTCPNWCTSQGGSWKDTGTCYSDQSGRATGCCVQHWAAKKACYQSTITSNGKLTITADACEVSNTLVKSEDNTILYGIMSSLSEWGGGMEISLRHSSDPYIKASTLTNGCSSGTEDYYPLYSSFYSTVADPTDQCFGNTPGQNLTTAFILISIGSCLLLFPAAILYLLINQSKNRTRPAPITIQQQQMMQQPGQPMMLQQPQQQQMQQKQQMVMMQPQQQPVMYPPQQQLLQLQQPMMIQQMPIANAQIMPIQNKTLMSVTIPAGVFPGQQLQLMTPDGRTVQVQVPQNMAPGMTFQIQV
jgi:hypothetical protein